MKAYQGNADYIAVCFSRSDQETALALTEQLSAAGLRVWYHERGCRLTKKSERERFAQSRTVLILVSAAWLSDKLCTAQLAAACELEKQHVLVFLDSSDLAGNEQLTPYLGRSVRMLDHGAETVSELMQLECITDCKADPGEADSDSGSGGFLGLFRR